MRHRHLDAPADRLVGDFRKYDQVAIGSAGSRSEVGTPAISMGSSWAEPTGSARAWPVDQPVEPVGQEPVSPLAAGVLVHAHHPGDAPQGATICLVYDRRFA